LPLASLRLIRRFHVRVAGRHWSGNSISVLPGAIDFEKARFGPGLVVTM